MWEILDLSLICEFWLSRYSMDFSGLIIDFRFNPYPSLKHDPWQALPQDGPFSMVKDTDLLTVWLIYHGTWTTPGWSVFYGKLQGQFVATEEVQPKGGAFSMVKYTDSPTVGAYEPRNKHNPGQIYLVVADQSLQTSYQNKKAEGLMAQLSAL